MKAFWIVVVILLIVPLALADDNLDNSGFKDIGDISKGDGGKGDGYYAVGPCDSGKFNACGQTLWSAGGTGAVELCGNCHPCGYNDGVCPEDFYSSVTETRGSCGACPDPDCTASIYGYVTSEEGEPYKNAVIRARYTSQNEQLNSRDIEIGISDENGYYENETLITGTQVKFYAEYTDELLNNNVVYISNEEYTINVVRGEEYYLNFTMSISDCEEDCTRERSDQCDMTCQGKAGCQFPTSTDPHYTVDQTSKAADGYLLDEKVPLGKPRIIEDKEYTDFFYGCKGEIQSEWRYITGSGLGLGTGSNDIDNLVTRVHRVWYKGEILEMVITYWEDEDNN